jgi:hypothetical protein
VTPVEFPGSLLSQFINKFPAAFQQIGPRAVGLLIIMLGKPGKASDVRPWLPTLENTDDSEHPSHARSKASLL